MARKTTVNKAGKPKATGAIYQKKQQTQPRKKERELAEVRLTTNVNRIEGSFPLYAKAAFEHMYIEGKEASYRIHIKVAELALKLDNMDDTPDSKPYQRASKTAVLVTKEDDKRKENTNLGANIRGLIPSIVSVKAAIGKSQVHSEQETLTNKRKVEIVRPLANTKWEIGHEQHGDPDQNGYLSGVYIENDKPLCSLIIYPGKKVAKVTATLSTRRSNIHVVKEGDDASAPSISKSLEPDFCHHLMEKLVALRLMNSVEPTKMFILAQDIIEFEPATEDDL